MPPVKKCQAEESADINQVGGNFRRHVATFDNPANPNFRRLIFTRVLMNFRNLQWMKLCQFILSGLKASHIIHLLIFLSEFHAMGSVKSGRRNYLKRTL